jgi:hypothetical protein
MDRDRLKRKIMKSIHVAASAQYGVEGQTDVFAVADSGQLQVAWVVHAGGWNGPAGIGPVGLFPQNAAVAASPQYGVAGQTDVFGVANNGQLHVAWVVDAGGWAGPAGIGPVGLFPHNAVVAASPQYGVAGQTDVFAVANNGQLHVAWVVDAGGWNGPAGIGPVGLFPPGAAVTASAQYGVERQTDVFAVANNGQLHVAWVVGGGGWNGPVGIGPVGLFPPGAAVAASPQYGVAGQTDVFAVANNGQLHVAWVVGGGGWAGPAGIGPVGLFPAGAAVTASPQYGVTGQTDVFAVANNGQLHVAWVVGGGGWAGPAGIGPVRLFPAGAAVAASPQYGVAGQTDVFAVATSGQLHVAWVVGGGGWNGPHAIGRIDVPIHPVLFALRDLGTKTFAVSGRGFSPGGGVTIMYSFETTTPGITQGESSPFAADDHGEFDGHHLTIENASAHEIWFRAVDKATGRLSESAGPLRPAI